MQLAAKLLILVSLLVCCSYAGDKLTLDDFKDAHRCDFDALVTPVSTDCSGPIGGDRCSVSEDDCGSAKRTAGAAGGQRETFVSLLQPTFPVQGNDECGSTVFDTANLDDRRWSTYFASGTGGFAEYTLDGAGSDPLTIDHTIMSLDVTAQSSIGFHFQIYTQFDTDINFLIIDNNNNLARTLGWQLIGLSNNIKYLNYLVPYRDLLATNNTVDLTRIGAFDIVLLEPVADDTTLRLFNTYAFDIEGLVWGDCANICTFDSIQERGLSGVTVTITGISISFTRTTSTDINGNFVFVVDAGTYQVCVSTPSGATAVNGCVFNPSTIPSPLNGCVTITVGDRARDYRTSYPDSGRTVFPESEYKGSNALRFPYTFSVVVIAPPSVTIECGVTTVPSASTTVGTASASSSCAGNPTITFVDDVNSFCGGTRVITRTWIANSNGASDTDIQVITVVDTTDPAFVTQTFPASATVTCGACTTTASNCLGSASATDLCSSPVLVTVQDFPRQGSTNCLTIIDRTWTATDLCDNSVDRTQVITIVDNIAPVFDFFPQTVTVGCNADISNPGTTGGFPTTLPDCDPNPSISWSDSNGPSGCTTVVTRTWRVTDRCNNVSTRPQQINKTDGSAPRITAPLDVTVDCDTPNGLDPVNTGFPLTFDDCSSTTPTYRDTATIPCEVITRTWSINDGCNPTQSDDQLINYSDPSPPQFVNFPPTFTASCSSSASTSPSQAGQPSARDTCSGIASISYSDSIPTGSCTTTTTRRWVATNGCGATTFNDQLIIVTDSTPPSMTIPPNRDLDCEDSRDPSFTGFPTVSDLCSSLNPISRDDDTTGNSCVTTIRRTWSVSDVCQNAAAPQTQIIVLRDETEPDFVGFPEDVTIGCLESTSTVANGIPGFVDDCSGLTTTLTWSDSPSTANCPDLAGIIRTWTVTDGCGNSNARAQRIFIRDDQDPIITAPPDIAIPCESDSSPNATGNPTVVTLCGEQIDQIVPSDETINNSCPTVIRRTWSVRDICGDTDSDIQIITLLDQDGPEFLNTPDDLEVSCADDIPGISDDSDFTVRDNCDPNPTVSYTDLTQDLPGVGLCPGDTIITRTYRAVDNCGNANFYSQTITIINVPPAECSPVDCTPAPCDRSSCPNQDCDCCGADPVPCQAVNCSPTNCNPVPCTAIPCSGCDVVPVSNGCQPVLCAPTYIDIDDDDVLASDRGGLKQVVVDNPKVSGSAQLVVSTLLLVAAFASVFVALF